MPLSKERMRERKRQDRLVSNLKNENTEMARKMLPKQMSAFASMNVKPEYHCYNCISATLYPDGATRCDFTQSETNSLGICVKPNQPACRNLTIGSPKLYAYVKPK